MPPSLGSGHSAHRATARRQAIQPPTACTTTEPAKSWNSSPNGLQPGLDAEGLVPGDAFEEGIDETDQQEGGGELRMELGRSAMPPEMMAGMAAAKVSRKKNLVSSKPFFPAISAPERN